MYYSTEYDFDMKYIERCRKQGSIYDDQAVKHDNSLGYNSQCKPNIGIKSQYS